MESINVTFYLFCVDFSPAVFERGECSALQAVASCYITVYLVVYSSNCYLLDAIVRRLHILDADDIILISPSISGVQ